VPVVELDIEIRAPAARVWDAVVDVERYPESMENVRSVEIRDVKSRELRHTAWSVILKGSILEWVEEEHLDHDRRVVTFHQVKGDMEVYTGEWVVEERGPTLTHTRLQITFEIGIPLLADMLNPVAQRSLHENCAEMLRGVERESLTA
jgi:ribosome-associated toxin RatA of RatAB toxin-antitoxin module